MLQNIKEFYGHIRTRLDGDVGHVWDFYFDDKFSAIREPVVETGH
jgi:hypothetical protein